MLSGSKPWFEIFAHTNDRVPHKLVLPTPSLGRHRLVGAERTGSTIARSLGFSTRLAPQSPVPRNKCILAQTRRECIAGCHPPKPPRLEHDPIPLSNGTLPVGIIGNHERTGAQLVTWPHYSVHFVSSQPQFAVQYTTGSMWFDNNLQQSARMDVDVPVDDALSGRTGTYASPLQTGCDDRSVAPVFSS